MGDKLGEKLGGKLGNTLRDKLIRLAVAVVAGLLMYAAFPPSGWWWAAVPAIAMLAWVVRHPATTPAGGFGYGFVFGMAFNLPLLPWIGGLVGALPWVLACVLEALFPALFGMLGAMVGRRKGWPVWLALVWVLQEWLKSSVPFGGFPWGVTAYSQTNGPFLALAQWGGSPLLSFAVALTATSVGALAIDVAAWVRRDEKLSLVGVVLPGALICTVLMATVLAVPGVRKAAVPAGDEPTITVAAIQGNVPRLGLEFNAQRRAVLDNHVQQTLQLAEAVKDGTAPQPKFVIWPENSADIDPLANADAAEQITLAAKAIGVPILVGAVVARPDATPENPSASNTVIVWDPKTGPGERHDKQIVQPFGEYLPWRSFFKHLSSYADRAGYFVPGNGSGVLYPAGVPVGVATCWEVIFDRALRQSVRNGAQLLAVPTNNATFDSRMSEQQLAFARLRAVEHGRYVVVAGTTGISAAIAPDGQELTRTEFFTPAYLDVDVRLRTAQTPATRWAEPIQWLLIAAAVAAVGAAILQNGGFVRPPKAKLQRKRTDRAPADRAPEGVA